MANLNFPLRQISRWDAELCAFCNRRSRNFTVRNLFRIISRLGDGVFWYALMVVLLLQYQAAALPAVIHMILVGLLGTAIYKFIKGKTLRPRPYNVYPAIVCAGKTLDQFSFPSGHTMHAVAFSIVAVSYYPALLWLVAPFAVLVALSPDTRLALPQRCAGGCGAGCGDRGHLAGPVGTISPQITQIDFNSFPHARGRLGWGLKLRSCPRLISTPTLPLPLQGGGNKNMPSWVSICVNLRNLRAKTFKPR